MLLLTDDVVQITAVRQSGVEAHGTVKTATTNVHK